jgi:hypothetical protein
VPLPVAGRRPALVGLTAAVVSARSSEVGHDLVVVEFVEVERDSEVRAPT